VAAVAQSGTAIVDAVVEELRSGLAEWVESSVAERVALLRDVRLRLGAEAGGMAAEIRAAQSLPSDGPWAAEPWDILFAAAQCVRAAEVVASRMARTGQAAPPGAFRARPDGGTAVQVFPQRWDERLLLADYRGTVWLQSAVSPAYARAAAGRAYRQGGFPQPGVALLLAAGNGASPTVSDLVHLLFDQGCTVAVKMNPVLAYLRPAMERVFSRFVERNWVRFVDEANEVGQYLAHHPGIDRLHMTGSAATYDGLVWGFDEQAERRRAADSPLLAKPFTAELGGVNPLIVVPGAWSASDVRRQADRIVFAKLLNSGHVCGAPQVLILPDRWDTTEVLLDEIRDLMRRVPARAPWYPGTAAKVERALADQSRVEVLQPPDRRMLVTVDADQEASLFRSEVFADVLAVVRLPAPSVRPYLTEAVHLANDRLAGSLSATVLVDSTTARRHGDALREAVAGLRYGAIGVNEWALINSALGYTTWGGYPGHTPRSIGSGVGATMNAIGLPAPQKSIVTGRFRSPIKTPFSVTNRTAALTMQRFVGYWTTDDLRRLPATLSSAARG
jgi:acyl-CoA reductase-like NAD-dependent aldehyde dehydrogenase